MNDEEALWAAVTADVPTTGTDDVAPPVDADSPQDQARAEAEERQRKIGLIADEREIHLRAQKLAADRVADDDADRRKVRLTPASHFKIKAVRWAWEGRMPLGEITLIPGREGVGKSTFLAWQAAALTRGSLPGMWFGEKKSVLYAATEDSWEHTIAPRMLAAGADMDMVYRIDVELIEGRFGKLSLPTDVDLFADAAREVEAAALMCDPVISILADRINTFKAQELRSALEPLRAAAERAEVAVAGLVHFNKGKDNDVLTAISGSRAWAEVARSVIAIAKDPDADAYTCVVSQVKNNLGRSDLPHLAYTIAPTTLDTSDGGVTEVGAVRWLSDSYGKGVEDILSPAREKQRSGVQVDALTFVLEQQQETGALVPTADVISRWGGKHTPDNLRQALSRLAREGALHRGGHGLYGAPEETRPCPNCSKPLKADENFCGACRRKLDNGSDRTSAPTDGLW